MNKVLGFIKGNLIIVISIVLILALLPAGYVFSSKWNAKVQAKVEDAYKSEKNKLTSSGRVNYAVPAVLAGERDISESRAPNAAVTAFYQQARAAREDEHGIGCGPTRARLGDDDGEGDRASIGRVAVLFDLEDAALCVGDSDLAVAEGEAGLVTRDVLGAAPEERQCETGGQQC